MTVTKADLQAAVTRLTEENAALRGLLAAVQETAAAGQPLGPAGREWNAGYRAAARIAILLKNPGEMSAAQMAAHAATFRRHIGEITALNAAPCPSDSAVDAFCACGEPAGHEGKCGDQPRNAIVLADCARCTHPADVHTKTVLPPGASRTHSTGCRECDCEGWRSAKGWAMDTLRPASDPEAAAALERSIATGVKAIVTDDAIHGHDNGCLMPSPDGQTSCARAAGHDVIDGSVHRDASGREWDDDGAIDDPEVGDPAASGEGITGLQWDNLGSRATA